MDCANLIKQVENKYVQMIKSKEEDENSDPAEIAKSSADFIDWFEEIIKSGIVDTVNGEVESMKHCILKTIESDPEGETYGDLFDALSLFSNSRLKEMFGVQIFQELDD
jgi:hypothetical protein